MRLSINVAPVLGVALLLGELGVAALSLFYPQVDAFYASYYIADARPCWLPPAAAAKAAADLRGGGIEVAKLSALDACYLLDGGWSDIEDWGVWSIAPAAAIELPAMPGETALALTVIGYSPRNRQSVKIRINGVPAGRYFVRNHTSSTLTIMIPPGVSGTLHVSIAIKHPAAAHNDQRQLGVGLIAINRY